MFFSKTPFKPFAMRSWTFKQFCKVQWGSEGYASNLEHKQMVRFLRETLFTFLIKSLKAFLA